MGLLVAAKPRVQNTIIEMLIALNKYHNFLYLQMLTKISNTII